MNVPDCAEHADTSDANRPTDVGVEKRDLMPVMFNEDDLNQQQRVKCAFDPAQILNPGKVFPQLHRCAELGRLHVHRGQLRFPDLPRF
jgi:glycolate oxidase